MEERLDAERKDLNKRCGLCYGFNVNVAGQNI